MLNITALACHPYDTWAFLKVVGVLWALCRPIACQKLVICCSNGVKVPFPCRITLYGGQVAAGPIKSCTMAWNNDEAESLTIGECREMATMSLHKATGPFSLLWHLEGQSDFSHKQKLELKKHGFIKKTEKKKKKKKSSHLFGRSAGSSGCVGGFFFVGAADNCCNFLTS